MTTLQKLWKVAEYLEELHYSSNLSFDTKRQLGVCHTIVINAYQEAKLDPKENPDLQGGDNEQAE